MWRKILLQLLQLSTNQSHSHSHKWLMTLNWFIPVWAWDGLSQWRVVSIIFHQDIIAVLLQGHAFLTFSVWPAGEISEKQQMGQKKSEPPPPCFFQQHYSTWLNQHTDLSLVKMKKNYFTYRMLSWAVKQIITFFFFAVTVISNNETGFLASTRLTIQFVSMLMRVLSAEDRACKSNAVASGIQRNSLSAACTVHDTVSATVCCSFDLLECPGKSPSPP